jgi:signal recognition particle receptor subunit beta
MKNEVIAKTELFKIVIHEVIIILLQHLKDVPILVLANKQDLKNAMN